MVDRTIDRNVRIKKTSKFGGGLYLALTGLIEEGKHYSIKKVDGKIIIEDIQDIIS